MQSNSMLSLMTLSTVTIILCLACVVHGSGSTGSDPLLFSSSQNSDMDDQGQREMSQSTFQHLLAVRSPKYNFGLGKRRYIIEDLPGVKRLPHYNFGLGKRGRMDLFDYEDDSALPSWSDEYSALISKDIPDYELDKDKSDEKRASGAYRYHFGLGKRRTYDFGLGKRSSQAGEEKRLPNRYNFGLGRR
ncbi:allatostatin-A [Malaya genurostris]|uniref:allatostatin-A n=1 Tax=Malaya genurostris TaxID=325434 RepID=UPI0026F3F2BB|nr:allatostatin-A [Malaya genurostris]XP_058467486.1 allatostatin-A [Malaya genurostris]XP_058467487.1 allatostatin-A [Malaya genurostris]XP_058467488.1 allatostatin-A [Malaya genurostris]